MEPPQTDPDSEFVALLTEHQSALRFYVASLLPGNPSVADIAQQANATIWRKRADFEIGTNFKAWVFSIARYEVLSFRKREVRDSRLVFSDELEEVMAEELPLIADQVQERQSALRGCLTKLRSVDRELIQSRYFSSESLQDYADQVGRSVGGLKVTLHRLRNQLQTCIEKQLKVEGVNS